MSAKRIGKLSKKQQEEYVTYLGWLKESVIKKKDSHIEHNLGVVSGFLRGLESCGVIDFHTRLELYIKALHISRGEFYV